MSDIMGRSAGGGAANPDTASPGSAPYWLVVVRQDRRELFAKLRRSFEETPIVEVIVDRRQGERRRDPASTPAERRRAERRRPPVLREPTRADGYRLLQMADGFQVFQAESRVPIQCSDCGAALEFEMPRFTELPARIEVHVLHTSSHASASQHIVETQAFRTSGRPFLACRIVARRRVVAG
jgi:hypothetical protein